MNRAHASLRGDQGQVLILVLAFVALMGLVLVPLLAQTTTSVIAARELAQQEARVSAVNAGLDLALQHVLEQPNGSENPCAAAGGAPTQVTINDVDVQIGCRVVVAPPPRTAGPIVLGLSARTVDGSAKTITATAAVSFSRMVGVPGVAYSPWPPILESRSVENP